MNRETRRKARKKGHTTPLPPTQIPTYFIKATRSRIIIDNPMIAIATKDGSFCETVPISAPMLEKMRGQYEAFFLLQKDSLKIHSMKWITKEEYENERVYQESPGPDGVHALPSLAPENLEKAWSKN